MRNRKHSKQGAAMLEFCLLVPFLTPLLLGTLWIGSAMIRQLQVQQAARDLASMYCRGVDFSQAGTVTDPHTSQADILPKLVQEIGTITAAGGTGVVIFSKITYVGDSVCQSGGSTYWDSTLSAHKDPPCSNWGHFVFTQRYTVGTASLHASNFGDPVATDPDSTDHYNIPFSSYVKNSGDQLKGFTLLPDPVVTPGGYKSGQPAYIVEVFFSGKGQIGYTPGGAYAYAIF
jgi:hypothetical protein